MIIIRHATSIRPEPDGIDEEQWNEAHQIEGLAAIAESGAWGDLIGIPIAFPPAAHNHVIADVSGLQDALDARQPLSAVLSATTASFTAALLTKLNGIAAGATANQTDAQLRDRSSHTGTQAAATITGLADVATTGAFGDLIGIPIAFPPAAHNHVIAHVSGLQDALDAKQPLSAVLSATTASFTAALLTKLNGIAAGATANQTDAFLRSRANHTGTQAAATISDFAASARAQIEAMLTAGANITLTASGTGDQRSLAIAAAGGGGGSGDVTGPAGALDDALAAFDGTTGKVLKAGLITLAQVAALRDEIIAARGDRSAFGLRIDTISNFASPNAGGVVIGQYYDNAFHAANNTTLVGAPDRIDLAPFYTSVPLTIDEIGVAVSTAQAGALGRCCIYSSGVDGWPDELVFEGESDLNFGTTGYKSHTIDVMFDSGRQYWMGVRHSSNATLRSISTSSAVNLGTNGSGGSGYMTVLRRTLAFAEPLPANWNFTNSDRAASVPPPSIRMRAAAP